MKPNITKKQLDELSDEQKKKLALWRKSHGILWSIMYDDHKQDLPMLTVLEMIEFLYKTNILVGIRVPYYNQNEKDKEQDDWSLIVFGRDDIYAKELCDALWMLTKSML